MSLSTKEVRCFTCPYFDYSAVMHKDRIESDGHCVRYPGRSDPDKRRVDMVCGEHPDYHIITEELAETLKIREGL